MLFLTSICFAAKPAPIPWSTGTTGNPLKIAIVGALPEDSTVLAKEVLARDPDLIVFTGIGPRTVLDGWSGDHQIMAASAKNPRAGFLNRFDGIGSNGRQVPYGTVDYMAAEKKWRVLYATAWPEPLARWNEQQFWTPGAAAPEHYDRLIVLLDSPVHSASTKARPSGARVVVDDVQDVTKPIAMPLVIAGNTGTNEAFLPGGPFGELHLVAGNSGIEPAEMGLVGGGFTQPPEKAPDSEAKLGTVAGYWWAELHGTNIKLQFAQEESGEFKASYTLVRDGTGWHLPE